MSRLTKKNMTIVFARNSGKTLFANIYRKLDKLEDLLEKYEIKDLAELEIALDQYYHRCDKIETRRMNDNE